MLVIPDGVTLMGGRGPTALGGMLEMSRRGAKKIMLKLGSNTRVSGLRLHGYNESDTRNPPETDETRAIAIPGSSTSSFRGQRDRRLAALRRLRHRRAGAPGGRRPRDEELHPQQPRVQRGPGRADRRGGFALIDHNLFDDNRHDVGSL